MNKLPVISGQDAVKAFKKLGYEFDRQKGSHMILRQSVWPFRRLTVPDHKTIAKGTLRSLLREAGITVGEFIKLL